MSLNISHIKLKSNPAIHSKSFSEETDTPIYPQNNAGKFL